MKTDHSRLFPVSGSNTLLHWCMSGMSGKLGVGSVTSWVVMLQVAVGTLGSGWLSWLFVGTVVLLLAAWSTLGGGKVVICV